MENLVATSGDTKVFRNLANASSRKNELSFIESLQDLEKSKFCPMKKPENSAGVNIHRTRTYSDWMTNDIIESIWFKLEPTNFEEEVQEAQV